MENIERDANNKQKLTTITKPYPTK